MRRPPYWILNFLVKMRKIDDRGMILFVVLNGIGFA